ncbi:MAG: protease modulator HflC [Verrucomicrobia bacterium]|nr:protease modulator HflC [Verrucomicrobiota bacterium]
MKPVSKTLLVLAVAVAAVWTCFFTVRENESVIVTLFGKPVRPLDAAGLGLKWPWEGVLRFDRRVRLYDATPSEFLTQDKKNIVVQSFVAWKIAEPQKFLLAVRDPLGAEMRLRDVLWSELSSKLGVTPLAALLSIKPEEMKLDPLSEEIRGKCSETAKGRYGIEVVDVRIKRLGFPTQNRDAVFERMRAERQREAKQFRAEGQEEGMKIRAEADKQKTTILAEANRKAETLKGEGDARAIEIYNSAIALDPSFYKFLRTLDAYRVTLKENTTLVLGSDSDFLKLLTEGSQALKANK